MGAISKSGLSAKAMGNAAYRRAYRQMFPERIRPVARKTSRRRYTGLSSKMLGHAAYMSAWRQLRRTK